MRRHVDPLPGSDGGTDAGVDAGVDADAGSDPGVDAGDGPALEPDAGVSTDAGTVTPPVPDGHSTLLVGCGCTGAGQVSGILLFGAVLPFVLGSRVRRS